MSAGSDETEASASGDNEPAGIPVVALGGSAGGLHALQEFFATVPTDTGCAFVVVTHQHPGRESMLPELLGHATEMPVTAARDGLQIEPDHVYVSIPDGQLAIQGGMLIVGSEPGTPDAGTPEEGHSTHASHHPVDAFFRSLAHDCRERAIAVVLSGSGTDGSVGLKDIKAESGLVLAQEPESAEFDGMPLSALRTNLVDEALPVDRIPERIATYTRGLGADHEEAAEDAGDRATAAAIDDIQGQIRERSGQDFSGYKRRTVQRRIQRRMVACQVDEIGAYAEYLRRHPEEIDALFRESVVSVTRFFRDPEAWKALERALEETIHSLSDDDELRAWVVGCATGEEAYTMAIVANECVAALGRRLHVHVFATDIEPRAIETARQGEYPAGIESDVPDELLAKYFVRLDDHYRVRNSLRERVVFALQSITQDPPFTRMDVVACRNLLIYMDPSLQQRVIPTLHYALKPRGLLLLGASESVNRDSYGSYFETVDRSGKLFRRGDQRMPNQPLPRVPMRHAPRNGGEAEPHGERPQAFSRTVERLLLDRYAPASAVVHDNGEAVYFHGHTGRYLEPASGLPGNNIVHMAREGLRPTLREMLRSAAREDDSGVAHRHARVRTNGGFEQIFVQASRLDAPESVRGLLLVSFQPAPAAPAAPDASEETAPEDAPNDSDERVLRLEREFEAVTAEKRWTVEQLEATNEDLQSANEELQSTNEELQSTNEELETSKEEMESLNEELSAVNAELQEKIYSLEEAKNDMSNMLNSTELAILFLNKDLEIRRFTERVRDLISVRESDIGRPIAELASNLKYDDLLEDARTVLRTVQAREVDFQTKSGHWRRMRMMPYWTADQRVDGVVCTFIGIDDTKHAENREAYFRSVVQTVREPLLVLDAGLRIVSANAPFYAEFDLDAAQVEGNHVFSLAGGQWDHPELRRLLEDLLPRNHSLVDYEVTANFDHQGTKRLLLNARQIEREPDDPDLILLAIEPIPPEERI